jgi:DDE superfamily endonuclease
VFWIIDNGGSHAGRASVERMRAAWPNAHLIHLPIHASWRNQIELFFSIVQRKALTPTTSGHWMSWRSGFCLRRALPPSRPAVPMDVLRADLDALLARLARREPHLRLAA